MEGECDVHNHVIAMMTCIKTLNVSGLEAGVRSSIGFQTQVRMFIIRIAHSWMIFSLDIHVYYPSGLHGDELDSPGSEDSDVYSQIDSLDRHPPVLLSSWIYARVIRNYHLHDEDGYVELLD